MAGNEELVELWVVKCEQTWLLCKAKTWARTEPGARNAGLWLLVTAEEKASCINQQSGLLAKDLEGMLVSNPVTFRWEEETRIRIDLHTARVFYTYFPSSTSSVLFSFHRHSGENFFRSASAPAPLLPTTHSHRNTLAEVSPWKAMRHRNVPLVKHETNQVSITKL